MHAICRGNLEIARVCKEGGIVVITVPSGLHWARVAFDYAWQWFEGYHPTWGYVHFFTPRELRELLERNSLEPIKFDSTGLMLPFYPRVTHVHRNEHPKLWLLTLPLSFAQWSFDFAAKSTC